MKKKRLLTLKLHFKKWVKFINYQIKKKAIFLVKKQNQFKKFLIK
jgi:hypothetical protein